jgi:hypothetical protein
MNKRQVKAAEDRIIAAMVDAGFKELPQECGHRVWTIESPYAGRYTCTLWSGSGKGERTKGAAIVGRFDEPKRAREWFDCNPYSGKENFHLCCYYSPEDWAERTAGFLNSLAWDPNEYAQHKETADAMEL